MLSLKGHRCPGDGRQCWASCKSCIPLNMNKWPSSALEMGFTVGRATFTFSGLSVTSISCCNLTNAHCGYGVSCVLARRLPPAAPRPPWRRDACGTQRHPQPFLPCFPGDSFLHLPGTDVIFPAAHLLVCTGSRPPPSEACSLAPPWPHGGNVTGGVWICSASSLRPLGQREGSDNPGRCSQVPAADEEQLWITHFNVEALF